jgi:hypothetical protein
MVRLTDGSVITLEAAQVVKKGQPYYFVEESGWKRRLQSFLPSLSGHWATAQQETLYLRLHKRAGPDYRSDPGGFWATDAHGCRFRAWGRWERVGPPPPTGLGFVPPPAELGAEVSLSAFPQRGEPVTLGYYPAGAADPRASFTTSVPHAGPFPEWVPEPLPIRKRSGTEDFSLERIRWPAGRGQGDPVACFKVTTSGRPNPDWQPAAITVADATGNKAGYLFGFSPAPGEASFPGLCTYEAAWKLTAEFAHPAPLRVKPDFTLVAANVPVPAAGQVSHTNVSAQGSGLTVRCLGIAGTGEVSWKPGQTSSGRGTPYVRLVVPSGGSGLQMTLARVTDERGRDIGPARRGFPTLDGYSQTLSPGTGNYDFKLGIPTGVKGVNLTFAFHRTRTAQFLVKP